MNSALYKNSILFLTFTFFFFSCVQEQKKKKEISFSAPVTVRAVHPITTLLDTCPKPFVLVLPEKGKINYIIPAANGLETVKLSAPIVTPLLDGEAGGVTYMQNFNTDQGLALSTIYCSFKDKIGNLWFGTSGGGVSKYDGKNFTNYTTAQGLGNNIVKCIFQDKIGNIWFGTNGGGVTKYDGKCFTNLTTEQGLANDRVSAIAEDNGGNLWFSTLNGVSRYNPSVKKDSSKLFINYTAAQGLAGNEILVSVIDKSGNVWFGTSAGASKFNGSTFISYTEAQGLANNFIRCMLVDKAGNIWFGTTNGVSMFSPDIKSPSAAPVFINYSITQGLPKTLITAIIEDKSGNLWFAATTGMSRFNPALKDNDTTASKRVTNFGTAQGLSNDAVASITEDKTGSLWIGTNGGGLSKYDGSSLTGFTHYQGLTMGKVWSIIEDKKGDLWFGSSGGLCKYDRKSFTNYSVKFFTGNTRCVLQDKLGNYWFGGSSGAIMFDGKTFTNYTTAQGLAHNSILSIAEDKSGNIWFGTYGGGVSKYDGSRVDAALKGEITSPENLQDLKKINGKFVKSFTNYTTAQGLAGNTVKCIIADKNGSVWFGTNGNGVSKFDEPRSPNERMNAPAGYFTNYTKLQGLSNNTIYSIMEDKKGIIWFGTGGGGVCRYDPSLKDSRGSILFRTFTSAQGLANDAVYAIAEDTINNSIWFGTNLGLSALKLNSISSASDEPKFENFNVGTGYPINDLNTGALFLDRKGILWAGTSDKLVRFDYSGVHKSQEPPAVFIQNLKIQGEYISWYNLKSNEFNKTEINVEDSLAALNEEVTAYTHPLTEAQREAQRKKFGDIKFNGITHFYPLPENLVLPYEHNNITFDFAAVETTRPSMVKYQYNLEGYTNGWISLTNKTTAEFGNIREGSYIFKIKAQSPDGIWSEPVIFKFKVLPPWFRTWWMYLIYAAIGLLLIVLFIRWREQKLKREKLILEDKVDLRTKQLAEKNKIVEEQKQEVEEKNIKITDSINYAKRIQQAILPSQELIKSFFPNSFIFFRPKDIVSGDFYWIAEKRDKLLIAVADCTGHGVPGAFMSMIGNTLLNEIVNVKNISRPNQILNEMNKGIVSLLRQSSNESAVQEDGMDISILAINKLSREIEFAGANHFSYLFNPEKFETLKGDVFSIGGMFGRSDINFTSQKIKIDKGSTIYLFTDGFVDQFGGEKNTKFLSARFEQLLKSIQQNDMELQEKNLVEAFDAWKGNNKQLDDILVVGIRF